jgi:hypothetical protein
MSMDERTLKRAEESGYLVVTDYLDPAFFPESPPEWKASCERRRVAHAVLLTCRKRKYFVTLWVDFGTIQIPELYEPLERGLFFWLKDPQNQRRQRFTYQPVKPPYFRLALLREDRPYDFTTKLVGLVNATARACELHRNGNA